MSLRLKPRLICDRRYFPYAPLSAKWACHDNACWGFGGSPSQAFDEWKAERAAFETVVAEYRGRS